MSCYYMMWVSSAVEAYLMYTKRWTRLTVVLFAIFYQNPAEYQGNGVKHKKLRTRWGATGVYAIHVCNVCHHRGRMNCIIRGRRVP
jgi:hypothetical protein